MAPRTEIDEAIKKNTHQPQPGTYTTPLHRQLFSSCILRLKDVLNDRPQFAIVHENRSP